jgi:hypothetical protein
MAPATVITQITISTGKLRGEEKMPAPTIDPKTIVVSGNFRSSVGALVSIAVTCLSPRRCAEADRGTRFAGRAAALRQGTG